jgi:SAM-dependent methyltransferase
MSKSQYEEINEQLIEKLEKEKYNIILDLGCGKNIYKKHITNIIGIDKYPEYTAFGKVNADIIADIGDLPFKNETVDAILVLGSLGEQPEDTAMKVLDKQIKEIKRVLKPNGVVYGRSRNEILMNKDIFIAISNKFDFEILCYKDIQKNGNPLDMRIYWEWKNLISKYYVTKIYKKMVIRLRTYWEWKKK